MALGLAIVWAPFAPRLRHAGLLLRPTPSWASCETYVALAFFLALATLAKVPAPAIELLVAFCAALLMICQAWIVRSSKSRPAWRATETPSLIVIVGLALGTGLIALMAVLMPAIVRGTILAPIAGMVLAAMAAYRWRDYAQSTQLGPDTELAGDIAKISPLLYVSTGALPFIFYFAALFPWLGARWMLPIAGVAAIVGGAIWMQIFIARLGNARPFTTSPVSV